VSARYKFDMDNQSVSADIGALSQWLQSEARLIGGTEATDQAIVDRLIDTGLPLARYTTGVPSLHPHVDSFSTLWERGKGMTIRHFRQETADSTELDRSPIMIAYHQGRSQRYRLEGDPDDGEYSLLTTFREAGLTDYVVLALPFSDGSHKAMSFATDRPGGFSDADIDLLHGLRHPMAAVIELGYLRHMSVTLMETYVGPVAGRRVLDGAIRRGSGETLRAVIWFCDLKGFTALSERLPGQVLIDTLNAYFDATTSAIETQGGEILKFIGDAVLAIFPPAQGDMAAAAGAALDAARDAAQQIERANEERVAAGAPAIECGIALHVGDVIYGNVGGRNRLDFTVIGPAVNLASRIEALTRDLNRQVLVSADFAAAATGDFEDLGSFDLKGLARRQSVFAPLPPPFGGRGFPRPPNSARPSSLRSACSVRGRSMMSGAPPMPCSAPVPTGASNSMPCSTWCFSAAASPRRLSAIPRTCPMPMTAAIST